MKRKDIFWLIILLIIGVFFIYPTPHHTLRELYRGSDKYKISSLDSFRTLPMKFVEISGQQWKYIRTGNGKETILFLHGMAGSYDIWWQQILVLKDSFTIISLTYPPVDSLKGMGEAVVKILDSENISQTHVAGTSLGGYFTQYLKTYYPGRFRKIILGNTFPPNDILRNKNSTAATVARLLPEWLVMQAFRKNIREKVVPASENSALVEAYLLEQSFGGMTKQQFLARYRCVVDKFKASPDLLTSPDVFIIESDNDPLVPPELRTQLRVTYPLAGHFTFHDKGHFPYLSESAEYTKLISEFLRIQ